MSFSEKDICGDIYTCPFVPRDIREDIHFYVVPDVPRDIREDIYTCPFVPRDIREDKYT